MNPESIYGKKLSSHTVQKKTGFFFRHLLILFSLFCLFRTDLAWAGPNSSAGCALDMDYATRNYDAGISAKDIDFSVSAKTGDEIWVAVVAQNVSNLDTYQVLIDFDPDRMKFLEGHEQMSDSGPDTLLQSDGGTPLGFQASEHQKLPGTIIVASTLKGRNRDEAPEGSGIIAFLKFEVLDGNLDNKLSIRSVNYLDSEGDNSSTNNLMNAAVNHPCAMILQILVGMKPDNVDLYSDINRDGKIGLEEAIHNLKSATGKK